MAGRLSGMEWLQRHINYDGAGCLIWPMSRDTRGYGQVCVGSGKVRKASRVMCELVNGPVPSRKHEASHSCGRGNKGCVHPRHLRWQTASENQREAVKHGTHGRGYGRRGKLSATAVATIKGSKLSNYQLGDFYGVHAETIAKIRRGETWKNH